MDVLINLIWVGWWCCHVQAENDHAFNSKLKAVVAEREGTSVTSIEEALRFLKRVPKKASPEWIAVASQGLTAEVRRLVTQSLTEAEVG